MGHSGWIIHFALRERTGKGDKPRRSHLFRPPFFKTKEQKTKTPKRKRSSLNYNYSSRTLRQSCNIIFDYHYLELHCFCVC